MKKSRFTDTQILAILKQGENGVAVADLCRVARRMFLICCSAVSGGPDFCLIFAPLMGYDEPEILRSVHPVKCPPIADGGHT